MKEEVLNVQRGFLHFVRTVKSVEKAVNSKDHDHFNVRFGASLALSALQLLQKLFDEFFVKPISFFKAHEHLQFVTCVIIIPPAIIFCIYARPSITSLSTASICLDLLLDDLFLVWITPETGTLDFSIFENF